MVGELGPLDPRPEVRYAALRSMRDRCPVHELGEHRFMAVSHEAVADGLRTVDAFGGSAGQAGLPEDDTMIAGILEPRHGQIRRIINSVVAFHKSQQIEPYLREFCSRHLTALLEDVGTGRPVEVMSRYVDPLPPAAMARLMGFPEDESGEYYRWGAHLGEAFGAAAQEGRSISMREACPELAEYIQVHLAARREIPQAEWPQDALTRFLTTEVDGERLSDRAIVTQIMFSIGAGSDTTRNTLGSLLFRLAHDPELYEGLREDSTRQEAAVEEALRLDSPAQFLVRQCLADQYELDGTTLRLGDTIMLSVGSANRDGAVYEDPDRYDPDRGNLRTHLAFGTGPHICPGATLARLELRIALGTWCDRVMTFSVVPDYEWDPPATGMLHGPTTLPLLITPA